MSKHIDLWQELQMDHLAKKHLQDDFDAALEEKDQMISVLQTQVRLEVRFLFEFGGGKLPLYLFRWTLRMA